MENTKIVVTESNKKIEIFDNVLSSSMRDHAYNFFMASQFRIGWNDTALPENKPYDFNIHCQFSDEDLHRLGILNEIYSNKLIVSKLEGLIPSKCILNLSSMSDVNFPHTHADSKVLLYYGNIEWPTGGFGETLFFSEDLKEIVYASPYTPGRLILFDGSIPHSIRPQSLKAPKFRFTLAIFFNKGAN